MAAAGAAASADLPAGAKLSECTGVVRPVTFAGGRLHLIDQKALPAAFTIVPAGTVEEVFGFIRDMTVRGAPAIGAAGALLPRPT